MGHRGVHKHVRFALRSTFALLLRATGCLWWARQRLHAQGAVLVLMGHRVLDDASCQKNCSSADIVVRAKTFKNLTSYIRARYNLVGIREANPGAKNGKLQVALTFDDGWNDNYSLLSEQSHLPFTVFICPGLMGKEMVFWPERVTALLRRSRPELDDDRIDAIVESLKTQAPASHEHALHGLADSLPVGHDCFHSDVDRTLSWTHVLEMKRSNVEFGSHTHMHDILSQLPLGKVRQTVEVSRIAIENELAAECATFAYPNGDWSTEARQAVEDAGFRRAFTTRPGAWTKDSDPLAIPRMNLSEENITGLFGRFSPTMFEYNTFWKAWRATDNL